MGPSFFSMSYEFTELFRDCRDFQSLELEELNPVYSVNFAHRKKPFLIYKDVEKLAAEFAGLENDFPKNSASTLEPQNNCSTIRRTLSSGETSATSSTISSNSPGFSCVTDR